MGNDLKKLNSEVVKNHNINIASRVKIFLFGTNAGKSHWFNEKIDHPPLTGITFKTESYSIGDKLPDVETIIYDTSDSMGFVDEHVHYISNADGIILTYNTHNIKSLNHLHKSIDKIIQQTFFSNKQTRCLLLGIKEVKESSNPLHIEHSNCVDSAQAFASKWNLFHKQIDITKTIATKEPYIYLLRRILKQKGSKEEDAHSKHDQKQSDIEEESDSDEDTVFLVNDIMGDFIDAEVNLYNQPGSPLHSEISSQISSQNKPLNFEETIDCDKECQCEFKRFLEVSLGKTRCDKYLPHFIATQSNDIRFVDPDIFDEDFLSNDDIKMSVLDRKLFQKEIVKYKQDTLKFERKLDGMSMKEKYHKYFVKRGIGTLWSFYFHIKSSKHIDRIINDKNDSILIWKRLGKGKEVSGNGRARKKMPKRKLPKNNYKQNKKKQQIMSYDITKGGGDVLQVEGDTDSEDGHSDSDEMYVNTDNIDGGLNVTTLLKDGTYKTSSI